MSQTSLEKGCEMHGIFKPLETAYVNTFGHQGIGRCTHFGMLQLFPSILKKVCKESGLAELYNM